MARVICKGDTSNVGLVLRMKDGATLTNDGRDPAPIKNLSRDCNMKWPSELSHASGGLATYCCLCGPHRRATVAGLRLVGGTVRSSQDASSHLEHAETLCQRFAMNLHLFNHAKVLL